MPDVAVPPLIPPRREGNLGDYPLHWASTEPDRVMASVLRDGEWVDVDARTFQDDIESLARGLVAAGIEVGDRVAIMCRTRYEWTVLDFALWTVGAVSVPVYETSSPRQVSWICRDSGAVAVVVENATMMATVAQVRDELTALRDVWQVDTGSLDELRTAGAEVPAEVLQERRSALVRADVATIIYTSGTTGDPKGCELTHDNFMGLTENTVERLAAVIRGEGCSTLLFLPLAHVFARFVQVAVVYAGARLGHTPDPKTVMDDLVGFRPSFLLSVPRVFEKIYNASEQKAQAGGKGKIFAWAARVADRYSRALDGGRVPVTLQLQHRVADRLVYGKLREAMGGRAEFAISGGAALGDRLGHFFRGIGLIVLEGYGLTETTAPATVNAPDMIRIGTVGRPLPGVSVRVDADGQIWIQGVSLFKGYHDNPEATAEAVKDGWFATGDLGELDADGFLTITGRVKEIIVTAGGKNVSPGPMEDRMRAHPIISQAMVIGEGRPFVGALVTLDEEMLPSWAENQGLGRLSVEEAKDNEAVIAAVQSAVDDANSAVSRAESIRAFRILSQDFTTDNGLLTPSMKLKRSRVSDLLQQEIEALYSTPKQV